MSKPPKTHMAAAKHLLRCLASTTNFSIVYKKGGYDITAYSGVTRINGRSVSYVHDVDEQGPGAL